MVGGQRIGDRKMNECESCKRFSVDGDGDPVCKWKAKSYVILDVDRVDHCPKFKRKPSQKQQSSPSNR